MANVSTNNYPHIIYIKSYVKCDLRERNCSMRAMGCLLRISLFKTLLFCGRKDRMRMRPLLELFVPRTRRRGSTSQPKCLGVEESVLRKTKRKGSEEVCGRSVHSYV